MTTSEEIALLVSCKHNLISAERLLGQGVNVHAKDLTVEGGKTCILIAAEQGNMDTLQLLLRYNANVHDQCPVGMTVRDVIYIWIHL